MKKREDKATKKSSPILKVTRTISGTATNTCNRAFVWDSASSGQGMLCNDVQYSWTNYQDSNR